MLLSEDHGDHQSRSAPLDLGLMVCMRNVELSYQSHQERLYFEDTTQRVVVSVSRKSE